MARPRGLAVVLTALLMLAAAGRLFAAEAVTKDDAKAAAAKKEAEKAEAAALRKAMLAVGRTGLCRAQFYFKQPAEEKTTGEDSYGMGGMYGSGGRGLAALRQQKYGAYIRYQMSMDVPGVLLDASHVLIGDNALEEKYIKRIVVIAPDGSKHAAARERLLDRAPGMLLKLKTPLAKWTPPDYVAVDRLGEDDDVLTLALVESGKEWWLAPGGLSAFYAYDAKAKPSWRLAGQSVASAMQSGMRGRWALELSMFMGVTGTPELLCNGDGKPFGVAFSGWLVDPEQKESDWQRDRLLQGPGIAYADLPALETACRTAFDQRLYECKVLFRQRSSERYGRRNRGGSGDDDKEWTTYGLAVGGKRLLVPQTIDRQRAARIEKIAVTIDDKTSEGVFVGAYREIGAFIVDLAGGAFPETTAPAVTPPPERGRLFFTITPQEKFGEKYLEILPNRWFLETRGYRDQYYISPLHPVPEGSWLVDAKMNVLGVYARQRVEGEELSSFNGSMGMQYGQSNARIFWSAELAPLIADAVANLDPQIKARTEEEAKRLVWLGVEFTNLSPDLAKQLKIEKDTKDGTIGLYVNRVYADSPAEKLGVKVGDILLSVKTDKRPEPIDLSVFTRFSAMAQQDWSEYIDDEVIDQYRSARPPWPLRLNYLTMLLTTIGENEKAQLKYLHDGKVAAADLKLGLGPRDFLSAKKYKNKDVGLTVKDLTYEVRAGLRLDADKKAVVIAKIETGSPSELAKLAPFELVCDVDGKPVASAAEFGNIIKVALEAKKPRVRLTVESLGKTRLADLDLTQVKPKAEANED